MPGRTARRGRPAAPGLATSVGRSRRGSDSPARTVSQTISSTFRAPGARRKAQPTARCSDQARPPIVASMIVSRAPASSGTVRRTSRRNARRRRPTSRANWRRAQHTRAATPTDPGAASRTGRGSRRTRGAPRPLPAGRAPRIRAIRTSTIASTNTRIVTPTGMIQAKSPPRR